MPAFGIQFTGSNYRHRDPTNERFLGFLETYFWVLVVPKD